MKKGENRVFQAGILALVFILYCVTSLEAATLAVGSGAGEPEDTVVIPISLSASGGEEVCGLNLDLHFDTTRLAFEGIALGEKAQEAGKSLSSSQPDEGVVRAVVVGFNQNTIDDGTVLDVTFTITSDAPGGSAELTIASPAATDCEGSLLPVSRQGGAILVEGGSSETTTTTTTTTLTSTTTTVLDCVADADCDDTLFCDGAESCLDGFCNPGDVPCPDDGLFCNGAERCDEEEDQCIKVGDPCPEPLLCDEENDQCTEMPPGIQLKPDFCYQSRWFPLLMFMTIKGTDTHFNTSSRVTFTPSGSLLVLPFVKDAETMFLIGLVFPSIVTPHDSVDISIITGTEEVFETIKLELLPFLLSEG